jgi:hypothetical protein
MQRQASQSIIHTIPCRYSSAEVRAEPVKMQVFTSHPSCFRHSFSSSQADPPENLFDKPGRIRFHEIQNPGNVHSGHRGCVRRSYRAASPVRASVQQ